ncbi:MAG: transglutaminase domain-containing protein [Streptosporangiaceae bacterium]|nr:transglutaminase domain-containing protein [Streptosporangiaceae bacterium]MBV9857666.1 transglutaminase domain-containing protein [Streptosporangiaceae bacterium]
MTNHRVTAAAAIATILASLSLYPIFTGSVWFWAGAGAVIAVAGAGTLTRLRQLPPVVCLAGGVLGLLLYLNVAFEPSRSLLGIIPTPESIRGLLHLAGDGLTESSRYAPPVPGVRGMLLLAAGGIGLTATLTDLLAARLRSSALAGLPLLMLFTEPFTVSVTRGAYGTTVVFCLGAAGYLALLSADGRERIRAWGRSRPKPDDAPDTSALAAAGRRVGLASVVVALCVPLFVPGLHATRLFSGGLGIGGSGEGGGGSVQLPDPEAQLQAQLKESQPQPVLRYVTSNVDPGYLQVYVLDTLTSSGWQMFGASTANVPLGTKLPMARGLTDTQWTAPDTTAVTIGRNVSSAAQPGGKAATFLPVPYPPTKISVGGSWQVDPADMMILSGSTSLAGLSYRVNSLSVDPPTQILDDAPAPPASIAGYYLKVPPAYDSLRALAQQITGSAKTPFRKAVALQNWLDGTDSRFGYTLNAPEITSASGLAQFLEVTKHGYCQQFSYAMAVLARLVGIPSTVAIGYTQGTHTSGSTWVVKTSDAHAWPELYFQGAGWIRFEPTPAGVDGQGTATPPTYTIPASPSGPPGSTQAGNGGTVSPPVNSAHGLPGGGRLYVPPDSSAGKPPASLARPDQALPWIDASFALLALLALAVTVPAAARRLIRRHRWRLATAAHSAGIVGVAYTSESTDVAAARAAWRELCDDLTDFRVGYLPSESPRALASRIAADLHFALEVSGALNRVALAAERAQYSARPCPSAALRRDCAVLRHAIAAAVPRRARWRARIFPASVLTPVFVGVSQVVDVFSRVNPAGIRRALPRRQRAAIG